MTARVRGADLNEGDVIEVWWRGRRDQIVAWKPYTPRDLPPARIAVFASGIEMTVFDGDVFTRRNWR